MNYDPDEPRKVDLETGLFLDVSVQMMSVRECSFRLDL